MRIWRKQFNARCLERHEAQLRELAGRDLVLIEQANRKTSLAEVASNRRGVLAPLVKLFGGKISSLPPRWWSGTPEQSHPIRIGPRLTMVRSPTSEPKCRRLVIPVGTAFGTGDHATTAMSLRLLEQVSRKLTPGWSMLDLGTGSGILALAASRFGASTIVAADSDPRAISTARQNAQRNSISGIKWSLVDVREIRLRRSFDLVSANLYRDLLIELCPFVAQALRDEGQAILSGVLRPQEAELRRALDSAQLRATIARRRGKWIALLCRHGSEEGH